MEDHHGWMLFGAMLASRKAAESARAVVPLLRDVRLRNACLELLDGQPGECVQAMLRQVGVARHDGSLWERLLESITESGRSAKAKRLADQVKLSAARGDFEHAAQLAKELADELGR